MPWWPTSEWQRMRAGADCPMCADAHLPSKAHSDLIVASKVAFSRLHRNQTQAGYSVIILRRHAAELHDLDDDEGAAFWKDVREISRAIAAIFEPVKLDTLVMGHLCPHVHCHVYPQYEHDDPHALIDIKAGNIRLSLDQQAARVKRLRATIQNAR